MEKTSTSSPEKLSASEQPQKSGVDTNVHPTPPARTGENCRPVGPACLLLGEDTNHGVL